MPWVFSGLRDGVVTTGWPRRPDPYFDEFPAAIRPANTSADVDRAIDACPTQAISRDADGVVTLDRGRCILCGRCLRTAPGAFQRADGSGVAVLARDALTVSTREPEGDDEALAAVRAEIAGRVRRLRRSVHIRHVDTGSDGSDEWEVQALTNPVYDVHRLGIFFTASPRHADILLVTGIGAGGMTEPLRRTRAAMAEPVVVIATGADAIGGGVFANGYMSGRGAAALGPVDVWVPGSPATPFAILHGILLALDRLPDRRDRL